VTRHIHIVEANIVIELINGIKEGIVGHNIGANALFNAYSIKLERKIKDERDE